MNESIARLSTGMRSVYGGDAAGQSVANTLEARSKSWAVCARNAEDGISAAQVSESALLEIASIAQRIRELGIQADNVALLSTTNDVAALDAEATLLFDQIDEIVENTTFNGVVLLGAADKTHAIGVTDGGGTVTLQTGATITAVDTHTKADGADATADTTLKEVAISLGNVCSWYCFAKGKASAYSIFCFS